MNGTGPNIKALFTAAYIHHQPALSPDGSKLLFVRLVDEFFNTDIFVRTLTTGATAKVAGSPASDAFPSWSPDGSRITFSSGRSGVTQIYTMTPSGGNVTQITHTNTAEGSAGLVALGPGAAPPTTPNTPTRRAQLAGASRVRPTRNSCDRGS